jgi:hypothetical protein
MSNETHEHDVSQASSGLGEGRAPEPIAAGEPAVHRRPYSPPRLRSLGKVAELTFSGGSYQIDHNPFKGGHAG